MNCLFELHGSLTWRLNVGSFKFCLLLAFSSLETNIAELWNMVKQHHQLIGDFLHKSVRKRGRRVERSFICM